MFALEAQTLSRQTALNSDFISSLMDLHCLSPETNLLTFPLQMSCPAHEHFCKGRSWRAWLCVSLLGPMLWRCFLCMHWFICYCQVRFTVLTVPGLPLDLVICKTFFYLCYVPTKMHTFLGFPIEYVEKPVLGRGRHKITLASSSFLVFGVQQSATKIHPQ